MSDPIDPLQRIEQAFRQARSELDRVGSARHEIEQKVAATSIKAGQGKFIVLGTAALVILSVGIGAFVCKALQESREIAFVPPTTNVEHATMEVGGAELKEYLAGIIDQRVVVIWSFRGSGIQATPASAGECAAGKYRLATLHEEKLSNGSTVVCSLLTPDVGVSPVLEPPSIYASSDSDGVIALSVSPRRASVDELAFAIRSTGANPSSGISVDEIIQKIREQMPSPPPSPGNTGRGSEPAE